MQAFRTKKAGRRKNRQAKKEVRRLRAAGKEVDPKGWQAYR